MVRLSSMVGLLQGLSDDLGNDCRVPIYRVVRYGFRGQCKDLEESAVKGDEVFLDKGISGFQVLVEGQLQEGADGIIGVKGDPIAIGCQDQKEVEDEFFLVEGCEEAVSQESMRDKAESPLNAPDALFV